MDVIARKDNVFSLNDISFELKTYVTPSNGDELAVRTAFRFVTLCPIALVSESKLTTEMEST